MQGLAPHHDDVEIFVCQTEGSKRWRLYKPHKGFVLPSQPSGDLKEEDLGAPVMEVTLKVMLQHYSHSCSASGSAVRRPLQGLCFPSTGPAGIPTDVKTPMQQRSCEECVCGTARAACSSSSCTVEYLPDRVEEYNVKKKRQMGQRRTVLTQACTCRSLALVNAEQSDHVMSSLHCTWHLEF